MGGSLKLRVSPEEILLLPVRIQDFCLLQIYAGGTFTNPFNIEARRRYCILGMLCVSFCFWYLSISSLLAQKGAKTNRCEDILVVLQERPPCSHSIGTSAVVAVCSAWADFSDWCTTLYRR